MPALLSRIAASMTAPKVDDDETAQCSGIVLKLGATTSRPKVRAFRIETVQGSSYLVYRSHRLFSAAAEVKLPLPKFRLHQPRAATAYEAKCVKGSVVSRKMYGGAGVEASRCFDAELLIGAKPRKITVFAVPDDSLVSLYRCLLALQEARLEDGGDMAAAFGDLLSPVPSAFAPSLFSSAPDSARSWRSNVSSVVPSGRGEVASGKMPIIEVIPEHNDTEKRGKSESTVGVDTPEVEAAGSHNRQAVPSSETTPASTVVAWHSQGPTVELPQPSKSVDEAEAEGDEQSGQGQPSSPDTAKESAKDMQKEELMIERKRASPCAEQDDAKRRRLNGSGDSPKAREPLSEDEQLSSDKLDDALQRAESPAISPVLPRRHEVTEGFDDEFPGTEDRNVDKAALSSAEQKCFKVRRHKMPSDCEVLTTDDSGLTAKRIMLLLLLTYALGVLGAGSMFCNGIFSLLVAIGSLVLVIQQKRARRVRVLKSFAQVERDSSTTGGVGKCVELVAAVGS
ncbi:hypothetical protein FOZ63_033598 [Perkinsus olseni]|uniref:Uncharacterized protein n=1 Tax=Perkinsus olseni TaxID=32597 RepID=A0A7J6QF79_PEROL|nr:hypothetical protein FOZ63_033598 [Perkinsus olseni]KAF4714842.1 hypothetical protein FOZ62_000281 [Perkinsus olseni]